MCFASLDRDPFTFVVAPLLNLFPSYELNLVPFYSRVQSLGISLCVEFSTLNFDHIQIGFIFMHYFS